MGDEEKEPQAPAPAFAEPESEKPIELCGKSAPAPVFAEPESEKPIELCGKSFGMDGVKPKLCTKPKGHQNAQDHGEKVCGYAE